MEAAVIRREPPWSLVEASSIKPSDLVTLGKGSLFVVVSVAAPRPGWVELCFLNLQTEKVEAMRVTDAWWIWKVMWP